MSNIPLPGGGTLKLFDSSYTPEQIEAAIGKGPMIQNGTWWLWDVATMKYWDTGYSLADGLGPGAVTTPMLTDQAVTTTKLADLAVTTPKLADSSVTWPKLAPEVQQDHRNLLDNWYFIGGGSQQGGGKFPINQRGLTEYTGAGYVIDRWRIDHNVTITLSADSLHYSTTSGSDSGFCQLIELPLAKKQMTLSFLMRGSGTFRIGQWSGGVLSAPISLTDSWGVYKVTSDAWKDPSANAIGLWCTSGAEADIIAAKLEEGPISTLARESAGGVGLK